jgi:hypothetical protein
MADVNERPFSNELLLKPKLEILEHFHGVFVPHRNAKNALESLISS